MEAQTFAILLPFFQAWTLACLELGVITLKLKVSNSLCKQKHIIEQIFEFGAKEENQLQKGYAKKISNKSKFPLHSLRPNCRYVFFFP